MTEIAVKNRGVDTPWERWILRALFLLFVLICVFDPANAIVGGKVEMFVALWCVAGLLVFTGRSASLPAALTIHVLTFVAIPLFSILWYYIINGSSPFE